MLKRRFLGDFRLGRTIGVGAFSKVKLATHRITGEKVAIKIIKKADLIKLEQKKARKAAREEREARRQQERQREVEHVEKILGLHGITIAPPTPSDGSTAAEAAEAADSHNPELIEEEKDNADAGSVTLDLGKEVNLLMRLDHPNIIRLYNVIETEHEYYIVMEYASGGEMIDYLVTRKRLSEIEARKFFRQLVSALDHCHSAHVVHRDLKLENLLLSADKNLLISDFGLGRTFRPVGEDYLSTFCGTPLYASPELVSGIKYIGPPADCWSAGVVLYALAAGKPPFQGDGISELYKNIKSVHYTVPDYFSPGLCDLLSIMLVKDPKKRATLDDVRMHPWVNEGYPEPPPKIPPLDPVAVAGGSETVNSFVSAISHDSGFVTYSFHHRNNLGCFASGQGSYQASNRRRSSVSSALSTTTSDGEGNNSSNEAVHASGSSASSSAAMGGLSQSFVGLLDAVAKGRPRSNSKVRAERDAAVAAAVLGAGMNAIAVSNYTSHSNGPAGSDGQGAFQGPRDPHARRHSIHVLMNQKPPPGAPLPMRAAVARSSVAYGMQPGATSSEERLAAHPASSNRPASMYGGSLVANGGGRSHGTLLGGERRHTMQVSQDLIHAARARKEEVAQYPDDGHPGRSGSFNISPTRPNGRPSLSISIASPHILTPTLLSPRDGDYSSSALPIMALQTNSVPLTPSGGGTSTITMGSTSSSGSTIAPLGPSSEGTKTTGGAQNGTGPSSKRSSLSQQIISLASGDSGPLQISVPRVEVYGSGTISPSASSALSLHNISKDASPFANGGGSGAAGTGPTGSSSQRIHQDEKVDEALQYNTIRTVRFSVTSRTVSSFRDAHEVVSEVQRVLEHLGLQFERPTRFMFICAIEDPSPAAGAADSLDRAGKQVTILEVEVCKIWLLHLYGVRIKRVAGSAWHYKEMNHLIAANLRL